MTYQIVSERKLKKKVKIQKPEHIYSLIKQYARAKHEQFLLITVNSAHDVISVSIISMGTVNKTIVHPREIFVRAITDRACGIIICHNHPSGLLDPSEEDVELTQTVFLAGEIVGIRLIDHVIFSKEGYLSLKQQGSFPKDK